MQEIVVLPAGTYLSPHVPDPAVISAADNALSSLWALNDPQQEYEALGLVLLNTVVQLSPLALGQPDRDHLIIALIARLVTGLRLTDEYRAAGHG